MVTAVGRRLGIDAAYFLRQGFWSVMSEVVPAACGLLIAIAFTRWSTSETFGKFQLLVSLLGLAAVASLKGLDTVVLRDAAAGKDGVLRRAIRLRLRWSLLSVPAFLAMAGWYLHLGDSELGVGLIAAAAAAPAYYTVQLWQVFLKGKQRFDLFSQLISVRAVVVLLMMAILLWLAPEKTALLFCAYAALYAVSGGWILQLVRRRYAATDAVSDDWRSYTYFLSKAGLVKLVASHIDKVLVGILYSPAVLAVYSIGIIIPNSMLLLLKGILETTLPKLAHQQTVHFRHIGISLGLGAAALAVTAAAGWWLIAPLFGTQYAAARPLALIAAGGVLLQPLVQLLYNFAQVHGRRRAVLYGTTFSPLMKFALLAILAPLWQEYGVALAYSLMPLIWTVWVLAGLKVHFARRTVS